MSLRRKDSPGKMGPNQIATEGCDTFIQMVREDVRKMKREERRNLLAEALFDFCNSKNGQRMLLLIAAEAIVRLVEMEEKR